MPKEVCIDRCICYDRTFAELRVAVATEDLGMDDIIQRFGCGSCCGMCRPYIERMLETGETVFHQIMVSSSESQRAS